LPAYNEESTISRVLRTLPEAIEGIDTIHRLVVDDGSTDRTADVAQNCEALVIRHRENQGVGRSFQTALEHALRSRIDVLITIDADGQFDSSQIPDLAIPILDGRADLVTGCRFSTGLRPPGMPRIKYWGNKWIAALVRFFSGVKLTDVSCGFRAYSREALLQLNLFGRFTYTQETILDLAFKGARILEVPVGVKYFDNRASRVASSIPRYALNAGTIMMRTIRDFRPMRFFGTVGATVFLVGLMADIFLFQHYLRTGMFSPYKVYGFVGGTLNLAGLLTIGVGFLADLLDRIRMNQERILYHHKKHAFGDLDRPECVSATDTRNDS
jgi:glycosyltransferase involved in cell wall biosynthesis